MAEWKPIETAPKDRPILAYNAVQGVYETRFDDGEWPHADWFSDAMGRTPGIWYPRPTHWMPLPASPLLPTEAQEREGAPGSTDAERAAWLADKIAGNGYCAEAAAMLRRWTDDGRAPRTRDHRALPDEMTHYPATVCACGAGALGLGHAFDCPHGPDAYARQLASAGGRAEPDDLDREAARIMALPEDRVDDELRALGIDPATAAQKGGDAVAGALAQVEAHRARCGGYVCGMCGRDTPHQHTPEEIIIFRNGIKRGAAGVDASGEPDERARLMAAVNKRDERIFAALLLVEKLDGYLNSPEQVALGDELRAALGVDASHGGQQ